MLVSAGCLRGSFLFGWIAANHFWLSGCFSLFGIFNLSKWWLDDELKHVKCVLDCNVNTVRFWGTFCSPLLLINDCRLYTLSMGIFHDSSNVFSNSRYLSKSRTKNSAIFGSYWILNLQTEYELLNSNIWFVFEILSVLTIHIQNKFNVYQTTNHGAERMKDHHHHRAVEGWYSTHRGRKCNMDLSLKQGKEPMGKPLTFCTVCWGPHRIKRKNLILIMNYKGERSKQPTWTGIIVVICTVIKGIKEAVLTVGQADNTIAWNRAESSWWAWAAVCTQIGCPLAIGRAHHVAGAGRAFAHLCTRCHC